MLNEMRTRQESTMRTAMWLCVLYAALSGAMTEAAGPELPWNTDYRALTAKLQGLWVVKGIGEAGSVAAWKVEGTRVTFYDARKKTEQVGELIFEAPCAVKLRSRTGEGWGAGLVVSGDVVYLGLGDGGMKHGDEIVACAWGGLFHLKASECSAWIRRFDEWKRAEAKAICSFDGKVFKGEVDKGLRPGRVELRFAAPGTLLSEQLAANRAERQTNWAAAKAKADELAAKTPG
jgi:hypothetical protein